MRKEARDFDRLKLLIIRSACRLHIPRSNFLPSLSISLILNRSSNTLLDDAVVILPSHEVGYSFWKYQMFIKFVRYLARDLRNNMRVIFCQTQSDTILSR